MSVQERTLNSRLNYWKVAHQFLLCFFMYSLVWSYTFSLLWYMETSDFMDRYSQGHLGSFLLGLCWSTLCPDWQILAAGAALGLMTCLLAPLCRGAIRASMLAGVLPLGVVLVIFSFTASSLLPGLFVLTASLLSGVAGALSWQTPEPEPFPPRRWKGTVVRGVVVTLFIISVPLWLFYFFVQAWGLPEKITETHPAVSPDGAYIAVIHNVDPNISDYSDVIIRPRRTFLDLFTGSSASTRLYGVDKIEWMGQRKLRVSGDFRPRTEQWHDIHIRYNDTASPEERQERDAMERYSEGR